MKVGTYFNDGHQVCQSNIIEYSQITFASARQLSNRRRNIFIGV
jgi:hypothetical protein